MRTTTERLCFRIILAILVVLALTTTACQFLFNYYPAPLRQTLATVCPPIGFNRPALAGGPIALDQIGWHKEWMLRHNFKVRHDAALVWKRPVHTGQPPLAGSPVMTAALATTSILTTTGVLTTSGLLTTTDPDPLWIKPNSPLMLRVDFYIGSRLVKTYTVSSLNFTFYRGDDAIGCHMLDYDVPGDLPVGTELRCAVTVLQADPDWQARYGAPELILAPKGQA